MSHVWMISYSEISLRLVLAALMGGVIGWEREKNNHPAGFRTHILVSVGSALIMLISIYAFGEFVNEPNVRFDPSRISAQVVSGIGFLGAGTILRHGLSVSGLTTAASLWVVAGIGLAIGSGFIFAAVLTTVLVFVSLEVLNRLENLLFRPKGLHIFRIQVSDETGKLGEIASLFANRGGNVRQVNIEEQEDDQEKQMYLIMNVNNIDNKELPLLCDEIREINGVKKVTFQ